MMLKLLFTSFNQKSMIYEEVHSLCCQTIKPKRIIIVDDGSTDEISINVFNELKANSNIPIPLLVIHQSNREVSAARNTGIRETQSPFVLMLDGDDSIEPSFFDVNDLPAAEAAAKGPMDKAKARLLSQQ